MKSHIKYRYSILFLFILFEVLLYNKNSNFQAVISIIEYIFIAFILIKNKKIGIMYFISFSLLSFGSWSYVITDLMPNNFWGIRLFGFSLNILFSILMFLYLLTSSKFNFKYKTLNIEKRFFIYFILYSLVLGLFNVIQSINYLDNFINDIFLYSPFFLYLYFFSFLEFDLILNIIKYCIPVTIFSMVLSYVFNISFEYDINHKYILMNAVAFLIPFSLLFFKKLYTKLQFSLLFIPFILLLVSGKIFIGGKMIIIIFITIFWILSKNKKTVVFLPIFFFLVIPSLYYLESYFDNVVLSSRFAQIIYAFQNFNIDFISKSQTSIGNIFAEAQSLIFNLRQNDYLFILGKGFGGGIKDVNGYLAIFAGTSGYSYLDAVRNDFFRMHLPIFDIFIKSGIFGFITFFLILIYNFFSKNIYSFIFFILLITIFNHSKEMLLLTVLFMELNDRNENRSEINLFKS